nr:uncharacterized protein LOC128682462 isoform X2 [Plodia interpunctella]
MLQFLASYGWFMLGSAAAMFYFLRLIRPRMKQWQEARDEAAFKKNPDIALARLEAIQRARERQQQLLEEASQRALEEQKLREERKRAELAERLEKYGTAAGRRLGTPGDSDYLPLSGGSSGSTYRPPKRSKCGGGGCGR